MANSLSTHTLRQVYLKNKLDVALRNALVAEDICNVDRSVLKTIENPYISQPTATVQSVAGTYSVSAMTTNDDTLTVTDEVIYGTHVYRFEEKTANFDLAASFLEDIAYAVSAKVDQYVVNAMTNGATESYTTPAGGFTTASNIAEICANLIGKVAGYQSGKEGYFLVIENTDVPGFAQAQVGQGFSYADAALNNGFMANYMGIDIYVVRSGTYTDTNLGSLTITNSGHRLFGVKNIATYASPRGVSYEEKGVTGKTGKELAVSALIGAKVWSPKSDLFVDITLA